MILQIVNCIQDTAANCEVSVLIGGGIALTLPGLTLWLAGLGMGRIAVAATGGLIGFVSGYTFIGRANLMLAAYIFGGLVVMLIIEQLLATVLGYKSFAYNFICSVFFSSAGVGFIFLGMIILLFYKGVDTATYIARREQFYVILLFAMAVFGTIEQLLLCTKTNTTLIKPKPVNKKDQPQGRKSWRNK